MDERTRLEEYINLAFDELYRNDYYLISNMPNNEKYNGTHYVGERAIVFRFAFYLQNLINKDEIFRDYNLDCEYNRNGIKSKSLPSFPEGTFPDLIIHKRSSNDDNLLIMEFKTYWNSNQKRDREKIAEFMDKNGEYRYKYGVAALITREKISWEWE